MNACTFLVTATVRTVAFGLAYVISHTVGAVADVVPTKVLIGAAATTVVAIVAGSALAPVAACAGIGGATVAALAGTAASSCGVAVTGTAVAVGAVSALPTAVCAGAAILAIKPVALASRWLLQPVVPSASSCPPSASAPGAVTRAELFGAAAVAFGFGPRAVARAAGATLLGPSSGIVRKLLSRGMGSATAAVLAWRLRKAGHGPSSVPQLLLRGAVNVARNSPVSITRSATVRRAARIARLAAAGGVMAHFPRLRRCVLWVGKRVPWRVWRFIALVLTFRVLAFALPVAVMALYRWLRGGDAKDDDDEH
jgi:hypothetical protein